MRPRFLIRFLSIINIFYLDKTKSTNDFCFELLKQDLSRSGIVICDHQSKGRGRYGRKWISRKGNIFCSVYKQVKNHKAIIEAQFSSLEIVKNYLIKLGIKKNIIKIKEPNDILIKDKKISGILIESFKSNKKLFLVVGIGLNLISSPIKVDYKTTFLNKYLLKKVDKMHFINFLKKNINKI